MKFYTRDWLDNKELRRCSPLSRSVLTDLMCLAAEGIPYGFLCDKVGPLTVQYMASRCVVSNSQFLKAVAELAGHSRLKRDENGLISVPRMVKDEQIRASRAEGGQKSEGHPNTPKKKLKDKGTLVDILDCNIISRAGARADSDTDSGSEVLKKESSLQKNGNCENGHSPSNILKYNGVSEFPCILNEIRKHDPAVDEQFARILVNKVFHYCQSSNEFPPAALEHLTDENIARCVAESYRTWTKRDAHGTGLLLNRVPPICVTWALQD